MKITTVAPRATAVVAATTTWQEFPGVWPRLLDEVYAAVRPQAPPRRWENVMLYRDDPPSVEVGVVDPEPDFRSAGRVVVSELPGGTVATTVHHGDYALLGRTHEALLDFIRAEGREPTGVRWEIYGHPETGETEIYWAVGGR
jgi:hypothetical protein